MNYYERYMGDYAADTGHLSLQKHGAYNVMLDTYYATEKPLPADYLVLYRICRAMGAKEQEAVREVADEFFPVYEDGLRHNKKADEVIAKAQKRIVAAKRNGALNHPNGIPIGIPIGLPNGSPGGVASRDNGEASRPQTLDPKDQKRVGKPPDTTPILITLPLREGGEFEVRQSLVAELEPLCPAVDVPATLKEMKLWLVGNPDRRKTRKGIRRFITNWLKTEQEKHGR